MRIVTHLSAFYDRVPVPADVKPSDEDIKSGKVMPGTVGGSWRMKVTRKADTHNTTTVPEVEIIKWLISRAMPQQGRRRMTRAETIADYLAVRVFPEHFHSAHIKGFELHDDAGPDEAMFRETLAPYMEATTAHGDPLIPPSDLEDLVRKYMSDGQLSDHLHDRFNVKRPQ